MCPHIFCMHTMYGAAQRQCHTLSQFNRSNECVRVNQVHVENAHLSILSAHKIDIDVATECCATGYDCKERANRIRNFVLHQR